MKQNSRGNTCVEDIFLVKLQNWAFTKKYLPKEFFTLIYWATDCEAFLNSKGILLRSFRLTHFMSLVSLYAY